MGANMELSAEEKCAVAESELKQIAAGLYKCKIEAKAANSVSDTRAVDAIEKRMAKLVALQTEYETELAIVAGKKSLSGAAAVCRG